MPKYSEKWTSFSAYRACIVRHHWVSRYPGHTRELCPECGNETEKVVGRWLIRREQPSMWREFFMINKPEQRIRFEERSGNLRVGALPDYIHAMGDGRGARNILLDGKPVKSVVYADTKHGELIHHVQPLRADEDGCVVVETLTGTVTVEFL